MHLFCPLCRRSCSLNRWYFGTSLISPTHRCGAALDIILSTPTLPGLETVHSDHMLCSCHLDIPQAPLSPNSAHPPSLLRVRDWSTVVASCHHTLSAWHQSVLAHVSGPLPDFPARVSTLDSLFDSLTRILFDCASLHSCRRSGSRPRTKQPLSGGMMRSTKPLLLARAPGVTSAALGHMRIRLVAASCASSSHHSSFLHDPLLERVALFCDAPSGTLLLLLTFATCSGMAPPALPSLLMRHVLNGAPIFLTHWGLSVF